MAHFTYLGVSGYNFKVMIFFNLKIFFTLTNNVYPDEVWHYVTFHLGLNCL